MEMITANVLSLLPALNTFLERTMRQRENISVNQFPERKVNPFPLIPLFMSLRIKCIWRDSPEKQEDFSYFCEQEDFSYFCKQEDFSYFCKYLKYNEKKLIEGQYSIFYLLTGWSAVLNCDVNQSVSRVVLIIHQPTHSVTLLSLTAMTLTE